MASKYDVISILAEKTSMEITKNDEIWKDFLRTAGRIYKYPFEEQVLIYAQRPNAIACASAEIWNKKMNCWINKGAHGIALINEAAQRKLKYVFDLEDVHEAKHIGRKPYLWKLEKEQNPFIIERLEKIYGNKNNQNTLEDRLLGIAKEISEDTSDEVVKNVLACRENTFLETLEEQVLKQHLQDTLYASIAYTLLSRCQTNSNHIESLQFPHIHEFNSVLTVSRLGSACSELCEPILIEIGKAIRSYQKNVEQKELEKTLAIDYNALKRRSESKIQNQQNQQNQVERSSEDHDNNLSSRRGLYDSRLANGRTTSGDTNEIWTHETNLFKGEQKGGIRRSRTDMSVNESFVGSTGGGRTEDGTYHSADGTEQWSERETKKGKSDAVGATNEQYQPLRRGNSTNGVNLQLNQEQSKSDSQKLPDFFVFLNTQKEESADNLVHKLLCHDAYLKEKKKNIASFFSKELETEKRTAFLQNIYNTEYTEFNVEPTHRVGYKKEADGLLIWEGNYLSRSCETMLTWEKVRIYVDEYLSKNKYFTLEEAKVSIIDMEKEEYEQLNFFLNMNEQNEIVPEKHRYDKDNTLYAIANSSITNEMINNVLITGGGKSNSRSRIFAKYQKGLEHETMTEFLKQEYKIGGKGFIFRDVPLSIWYDKTGMNVAKGTAAKYKPMFTLSWEEVEEKIHDLIVSGNYMDKTEMWQVPVQEKKELASKIYFFFRDEYRTMPPEISECIDYPKAQDKIIEHLSTPKGIEQIVEQMDKAISKIHEGVVIPSLRSIYKPEDIRQSVEELKREILLFPMATNLELPIENFITQDEIDYELSQGSNFSEGLFRIYDYFLEGHNKKEQADFLKHEYGTGDKCPGITGSDHSMEDHNANGLKLSKGIGTAQILLTWTKVAERIQILMNENHFISPQEEKKYQEWKANKEQKAMEQEKSKFNPSLEISKTEEKITDVLVPPVYHNFHITDDKLGTGSGKIKFTKNIKAIEILQLLERENRSATLEEQENLSQYTGWGGLAEAFDDKNALWANEYQKLKNTISFDEYLSARQSTLNAHYTSPPIIRTIYSVLGKMGFTKGNVLEPAMGIGNFLGMLPEEMQESHLYGVELDSLTGRIAKQLYPKANIQVCGFENTDYPNDFFDIVIGNVPFGQYKVSDKPYDKHNFFIHDYFLAKSLDKVRIGGVIAVVTSKGTLDKKNEAVRKYLAQRAELLGAIRLPNSAFKENAGTDVTTDILFLKKRDRIVDIEPEWVHLAENTDGVRINQYFVEHPEMIVGKMELVSGPYGIESTCQAVEGDFSEQLGYAASYIEGNIESVGLDELEDDIERVTILADPRVKNFSYTVLDDELYYRENSIMKPIDVGEEMLERMRGILAIRACTNELIAYQLEEYTNEMIQEKQIELNQLYDEFSKKFGLLNSKINKKVFHQDSSYYLLCSLEHIAEDGTLERKADMFTRRTIRKNVLVTNVDTANEALVVSISEKAMVDLSFMSKLMGQSENVIIKELEGIIFQNPLTKQWETADEYLSGNVREKLEIAKEYAKQQEKYTLNVNSLEKVQPKRLDASEIEIRLGTTWLDPVYIEDFMREVFETPENKIEQSVINVRYSKISGQWNIQGKNSDYGNVFVEMTYGTKRANAYKILENSLNLKDTRIFDIIMENGSEKRILNKRETMLALQKQEAIKEAFHNWIFKDCVRREELCKQYNELFNSSRAREYDGSHLQYPGMTPDIAFEPHQNNAVAHQLYGNNTLLAHCVGAGKTFEMIAAAMEYKRLGLAQKSLFVVPNHLIGQWASDFLQLYPGANILAATKKDFEPANRKKFCSRIATGDYDGIIIGHSQFERIPLSKERQEATINQQIDEITQELQNLKMEQGERYTIKQMEKTKRMLETRLKKLNDATRKDDVVTFEQLGVDRLFVDESHGYKNLFLFTKMRNVAGISQTEAQKSSDMFAKCQYLDELTGSRGITFATGTPISNSMTELYTNMRYLQYDKLQELGLGHFDSWAATFGETVTAIELAPEGTGYRAKTRFAKFFNLPELISIFKESADIQTADALKLPVPEVVYENVVLKPSEYQKAIVKTLAERAEAVRNRTVDSSEENMLKITNDGRKLALEQRLMNPLLPDNKESKASVCGDKAFEIWKESAAERSTQLIFCDLSTPNEKNKVSSSQEKDEENATFRNVYEDVKNKLIVKGVPAHEIAFIHDANTELRKTELFAKVRSGQVRFLLGSTAKMGAGMNVQEKLIAEHHLDVPWVRLEVA